MTEAELITLVTSEIKDLASNFVANDYVLALDQAKRETGFVVSTAGDFQLLWITQRTKRHLIYSLWIQNATKFKVKQLSLDQKFDHLGELVKKMDLDFENAREDPMYYLSGLSPTTLFGHQIDSGFLNDPDTGEDLTYTTLNAPSITPGD